MLLVLLVVVITVLAIMILPLFFESPNEWDSIYADRLFGKEKWSPRVLYRAFGFPIRRNAGVLSGRMVWLRTDIGGAGNSHYSPYILAKVFIEAPVSAKITVEGPNTNPASENRLFQDRSRAKTRVLGDSFRLVDEDSSPAQAIANSERFLNLLKELKDVTYLVEIRFRPENSAGFFQNDQLDDVRSGINFTFVADRKISTWDDMYPSMEKAISIAMEFLDVKD